MPKTHKIKFIQPDSGKTCELEVTTPDKVDSAEYVFTDLYGRQIDVKEGVSSVEVLFASYKIGSRDEELNHQYKLVIDNELLESLSSEDDPSPEVDLEVDRIIDGTIRWYVYTIKWLSKLMPALKGIDITQEATGDILHFDFNYIKEPEYVFSVNPTVADLDTVGLKSSYEGSDVEIDDLPKSINIAVTSKADQEEAPWVCTDNVGDYPDWAQVVISPATNSIVIYKTKELYTDDDTISRERFTVHLKQDVSNKTVEVPVSQTTKKPKYEFYVGADEDYFQVDIVELSTPEEVAENDDLYSYVDIPVHSLINGENAKWEIVSNRFPNWLDVTDIQPDKLRITKLSHNPDGVYRYDIIVRQIESGLEDRLLVIFDPYYIDAFPRTFDGNFSGYEYETISIPFHSVKIEGPSWLPMDDIEVNIEVDEQLRRDLEMSPAAPLEVSDKPTYEVKSVPTEDGDYVGNFVLEVTWESVMFTCIREIEITQVESGRSTYVHPKQDPDLV